MPTKTFPLTPGPRTHFLVSAAVTTFTCALMALVAASHSLAGGIIGFVAAAPLWGFPWLVALGTRAELDGDGLTVRWCLFFARRIRWDEVTAASIGKPTPGRREAIRPGYFGFPFYLHGRGKPVVLLTDAFGKACFEAVVAALEARGVTPDVSALRAA